MFADWLAHRNAVFDVEWMPGANKLLTASGDQTIALWDVEAEQIISVFRGHSSSVKTVRFLASNDGLYRDYCHSTLFSLVDLGNVCD